MFLRVKFSKYVKTPRKIAIWRDKLQFWSQIFKKTSHFQRFQTIFNGLFGPLWALFGPIWVLSPGPWGPVWAYLGPVWAYLGPVWALWPGAWALGSWVLGPGSWALGPGSWVSWDGDPSKMRVKLRFGN